MGLSKYKSDIEKLTSEIRSLIDNSKREIYKNVNNQILLTYWKIGNRIRAIEEEKAFDNQSSRFLITELSKELTRQLGKGYNRSNLTYMRLFSLRFSRLLDIFTCCYTPSDREMCHLGYMFLYDFYNNEFPMNIHIYIYICVCMYLKKTRRSR